jgi:nucleotide-binding universal stress UspA family protein
MKSFDKVLFPVDLSEVSPRLAPWVRDLATTLDAEVHLLFVARRLEHFAVVYVAHDSIESFEQEVIKGAEQALEEFARDHFESRGFTRLTAKVVQGDAAEEILEYARSEGVDMIVMGTHGRKGLEKVVFGSVADRVVKTATAPVLTINPYRTVY